MIEGRLVRLRAFEQSDLDANHAFVNDYATLRDMLAGMPLPASYEDERRWLDYDQKAKAWETLEEFLATHADIPMTQESFAQFSQQLAPLVNAIRIFPHDGRRMLGVKALNSRLEQLGLCFKLQKMERNSKTILKKEEELGYV